MGRFSTDERVLRERQFPVWQARKTSAAYRCKRTEDAIEADIDLPGFKKDEIQVHLENGYLTVSAEKHADKQTGKGKYLRQERYSGTVSRTFYVGDTLKPDDVKAKYEDGVLVISLSKKVPEAIEQRSQIAIEG